MNQEQRAALRKVAEEATPVAWSIFFADEPCEVYLNKDDAKSEYMRRNEMYPDKSREFKELYQFNPSTILQLLDYIETLEKDASRHQTLKNNDFCIERFVNHSYGWKAVASCDLDEVLDAAMQGETE